MGDSSDGKRGNRGKESSSKDKAGRNPSPTKISGVDNMPRTIEDPKHGEMKLRRPRLGPDGKFYAEYEATNGPGTKTVGTGQVYDDPETAKKNETTVANYKKKLDATHKAAEDKRNASPKKEKGEKKVRDASPTKASGSGAGRNRSGSGAEKPRSGSGAGRNRSGSGAGRNRSGSGAGRNRSGSGAGRNRSGSGAGRKRH